MKRSATTKAKSRKRTRRFGSLAFSNKAGNVPEGAIRANAELTEKVAEARSKLTRYVPVYRPDKTPRPDGSRVLIQVGTRPVRFTPDSNVAVEV